MTDSDIKNHAKKILKALIYAMKIKGYDLCPCGSGKKYKRCCDKKDGGSIIFTETAFKEVREYKKSQEGVVQQIPQGLWNNFSEASLNRFCCLYPNCNNPTISCHLVSKNILKKSFGDHCLESKPRDGSNDSIYTKTGVRRSGTLPVFCSYHDNNLFLEIDDLEINFTNKKHLFLLAFKAISFSLRNTQYLMGIDSQREIFRPTLYLDSQKNIPQGSRVTLQIPKHTSENYLRLKITNDVFKDAIKILEKEEYNIFSYFHRNFDCKENIFFSSFINPLYDLNDKRINDLKTPINMTINIFTKNNKIHVLLTCPSKSKKLYFSLFQQLKKVNKETFINFINKTIESAVDKPLLPLNFNFNKNFLKR